ncbi:DMT family transporter [Martelella alba]|uniref:DMT family transporter n=1 Tax=Martelella alba TaxID=2590451 RepID=A0A506U424_9HYPH|nr:DMT family transporter [Martelella alba]TPW28580.1 DMT family transporter [Martelella alba]
MSVSPPSVSGLSGAGFAIVATLFFSGVDALAKSLGAELSSFQVVFLRTSGSALFLVIFMAFVLKRGIRPGQMKSHALRGFLMAVTAMLFFYAVARLPLVMALALAMTSPIYLALMGAFFLKERLAPATLGAVVLAVLGAGVITFARDGGGADDAVSLAPLLAALLAPLTYAAGALVMKLDSARDHPAALSMMQSAFAALFALPTAAIFWQSPDAGLYWQIALIGLFGAVGYLLLIAGLSRIPASVYAVIDYTALVWAGLFGFLFFGEIPTPATLAGSALILSACIVSARAMRHRR